MADDEVRLRIVATIETNHNRPGRAVQGDSLRHARRLGFVIGPLLMSWGPRHRERFALRSDANGQTFECIVSAVTVSRRRDIMSKLSRGGQENCARWWDETARARNVACR